MTTLVEQMGKYIDLIEGAVSNEYRDLRYCYIDISTAISTGETAIRIFPKEGRNRFFTNATRDVSVKLGDIDKIIDEAKSTGDKIRIIISRESNYNKQLTRYINSENAKPKIINEIMHEIKELAENIKS